MAYYPTWKVVANVMVANFGTTPSSTEKFAQSLAHMALITIVNHHYHYP